MGYTYLVSLDFHREVCAVAVGGQYGVLQCVRTKTVVHLFCTASLCYPRQCKSWILQYPRPVELAVDIKSRFIRASHRTPDQFGGNAVAYGIGFVSGILDANMQMAKKMADNGYNVYLLSNPQSSKSADFIFVKGGKAYYTEGKLSTGKNSLDHNLAKGGRQSERILIDLTNTTDTNYISSQLERAFQNNSELREVMLLKGGRLMNISRQDVEAKGFDGKFKRKWEQRK